LLFIATSSGELQSSTDFKTLEQALCAAVNHQQAITGLYGGGTIRVDRDRHY